MNTKAKKILVIIGGLLVCAALAWAISVQFDHSGRGNGQILDKPDEAEVSVQPIQASDAVTGTQAVTATPIPDQTDKTEQIIQATPVKPTATPDFTPTQEQLDSGKVPSSNDTASVVTPAAAPPSAPSGGGAGQIHVPGFGWMNAPGEAEGSVATDMYENGNKVGSMD